MNDVSASNPEIARNVEAGGIATNYHDVGSGTPVLMIHGSGPGVSAWVNWRLVMPSPSSFSLPLGAAAMVKRQDWPPYLR